MQMLNFNPAKRDETIRLEQEKADERIRTGKTQKFTPQQREQLKQEKLAERYKFESTRMRGYELLYPCTDKNLKVEYEMYLKKSQEIWDDFFIGKNKPGRANYLQLKDTTVNKFKKLFIETKPDDFKLKKYPTVEMDRTKQLVSVSSLKEDLKSEQSPCKLPESPLSHEKFGPKMITDDQLRESRWLPLKDTEPKQINSEKKKVSFPHVSQVSAVSVPMQRYQLISIKEEMAMRESIESVGKVYLPKTERQIYFQHTKP